MQKIGAAVCLLFLVLKTGECALSVAQKQELLNLHNAKRRECVDNVANVNGHANEAASNMRQMYWDPALEAEAQAWADACVYEHSDSSSGENLAISSPISSGTVENRFLAWYNEYDYIENEGDWWTAAVWAADWNRFSDVGHFSQVCWATSERLGCGLAECTPITGLVNWNQAFYVVCNYGPAGNIGNPNTGTGQDMFSLNTDACDDCPNGYTCVDRLCDDPDTDSNFGQDGPCQGVYCTPPDDCHTSVCNTNNGNCDNTAKPDGATCTGSDGAGTCASGVCEASGDSCDNVLLSGAHCCLNAVFTFTGESANGRPTYYLASYDLYLFWNNVWNRWLVGDVALANAGSISYYAYSTEDVLVASDINALQWAGGMGGGVGDVTCSAAGGQADQPDNVEDLPNGEDEALPEQEDVGDPVAQEDDANVADGDDGDDGGDSEGGAVTVSAYGVVFAVAVTVLSMF